MERQTVAKIGKAYFITFVVNGVTKRWQGTREDLIHLQYLINKVLDTVGDNRDGKPGVKDR